MRRSVIRVFLACVLFVAIPVQGFAAVFMLGCEMTQAPVSASSVQKVVKHDQHAHDHQAYDHHAHDVQHDHSSVSMSDTGQDDLHALNADQHESHVKHKSCSSGCATVVLDGELPQVTPSRSNSTVFTYVLSLHLPPILAGLDRPPQQFLA